MEEFLKRMTELIEQEACKQLLNNLAEEAHCATVRILDAHEDMSEEMWAFVELSIAAEIGWSVIKARDVAVARATIVHGPKFWAVPNALLPASLRDEWQSIIDAVNERATSGNPTASDLDRT